MERYIGRAKSCGRSETVEFVMSRQSENMLDSGVGADLKRDEITLVLQEHTSTVGDLIPSPVLVRCGWSDYAPLRCIDQVVANGSTTVLKRTQAVSKIRLIASL